MFGLSVGGALASLTVSSPTSAALTGNPVGFERITQRDPDFAISIHYLVSRVRPDFVLFASRLSRQLTSASFHASLKCSYIIHGDSARRMIEDSCLKGADLTNTQILLDCSGKKYAQ